MKLIVQIKEAELEYLKTELLFSYFKISGLLRNRTENNWRKNWNKSLSKKNIGLVPNVSKGGVR